MENTCQAKYYFECIIVRLGQFFTVNILRYELGIIISHLNDPNDVHKEESDMSLKNLHSEFPRGSSLA